MTKQRGAWWLPQPPLPRSHHLRPRGAPRGTGWVLQRGHVWRVWEARLMATPNLTPAPGEGTQQDGDGEEPSGWVGSWLGR